MIMEVLHYITNGTFVPGFTVYFCRWRFISRPIKEELTIAYITTSNTSLTGWFEVLTFEINVHYTL